MLIGSIAAVTASLLFNFGLALQALEARQTPKTLGLRLGLVGRLLRRPRWLLGQVLGTVGIGPQVYAFSVAPFFLVQPLLAVGLVGLLAVAARALGERVDLAAATGVAAIIAGIALVAWGAPARHEAHRGVLPIGGVLAGLAIAAAAPYVLAYLRRDVAVVVMVAAGCGFAATNIVAKLLSDDLAHGHDLQAVAWAVIGLGFGLLATVTGMTAFQLRPATTVVPVTTAVQTFLPILLEPLILQERWGAAAFDGIPLAAGTLIALAGTVLVAHSRGVAELASGAS